MRAKRPTANPALPAAEPAIRQLNLKPKHNTKKVEDPDELRLLKQVIAEARSFRRPDHQERQDAEK